LFGRLHHQNPSGYCALLGALIAGAYPERAIRVINAGVGGNKVGDMVARLERDVLVHRPDWVTLSVGINDVWHGMVPEWGTGHALVAVRGGVGMLAERITRTGARLILLPPTVIEEDPSLKETGVSPLTERPCARSLTATTR
jgi:lysophospholipase L1-like esterase